MDILHKGTLIKDVRIAQDSTGYIANDVEFYPAADCTVVKVKETICQAHARESEREEERKSRIFAKTSDYGGTKEEWDSMIARESKADRYNNGKTQWGLVDFKSIKPMVDVLEFGALKYSPNNWKKGLDTTEICESIMRHLTALMDGEDNDPESGLPHMGHIQCNTMFYNYMVRNKEIKKKKDD